MAEFVRSELSVMRILRDVCPNDKGRFSESERTSLTKCLFSNAHAMCVIGDG